MSPTSSDPALVLSERRGNVLLLTLNRPDRMNAMTLGGALEQRYYELLDEAERDPEVRAIVVTGAGRVFCAGADLDDLKQVAGYDSPDASLNADHTEPTGDPPSRPWSFPLTIRMPIIAAVNGPAVGAGLVQALFCDLRFATPTARFSTAFARWGLSAEYAISWLLPRLVGSSNALDLLLSGRPVAGREALEMGLINRVVEPEALVDEAVAYAQEIATYSSPHSIAVIKAQVRQDLDSGLDEAIARSDALMRESVNWPDLSEGVASFMEKRPPRFAPLAPRT